MWLNNVKLVLKDRVVPCARVRIENGVFTDIIESYGRAAPRFTVIPGLIDLHAGILKRDHAVEINSPLHTMRSLVDADHRLVSNGITLAYTAIDFTAGVRDFPTTDYTLNLIDMLRSTGPEFHTDIRIHGRFGLRDKTAPPLIRRLLDTDDLHFISIIDRSGQHGASLEVEHWKSRVPQTSYSEAASDEISIVSRAMWNSPRSTLRDWDRLRDVVETASAYGIPVASHDDDTVEKIDLLASIGVRISEFPVTMEAAARAYATGMQVVMGAPNAYRGRSTRGNLSAQEAARHGVLDILATDYFPPLLLQAAYKLAECGILSLSESINLITLNPARAAGLHDRGHIAIGTQADFVVLEEGYVPRVRATYRAGKAIYSDGTAITEMAEKAAAG